MASTDLRSETSAEEAPRRLDDLRRGDTAVALVLASQWMAEMAGTTLLARAHELHPTAGRGLLIHGGDRTQAEPAYDVVPELQIAEAVTKRRNDDGRGRTTSMPNR